MKFTCEKHLLQGAVNISSRAAAAKSPISELEGLLLEAGESLRVTGYDLKKGIYSNIEAEVKEPGSVVLNAKLFGEMVRRLPDGMVTVSSDSKCMTTVRCGKTEFSFMGMNAESYPELPSVDGLKSYTVSQPV
ncbi:MAG: DNA polymerase III subunit beta, partial [Oscillospiraceae bacterium]|nr:DNA polymerase III subunit beta [Oscillospiraceae bacterium]